MAGDIGAGAALEMPLEPSHLMAPQTLPVHAPVHHQYITVIRPVCTLLCPLPVPTQPSTLSCSRPGCGTVCRHFHKRFRSSHLTTTAKTAAAAAATAAAAAAAAATQQLMPCYAILRERPQQVGASSQGASSSSMTAMGLHWRTRSRARLLLRRCSCCTRG
jgi:hypothetical protein